jgi:MFS family permease
MTGGSWRRVIVLCGIQFVDVLGVTSGITALPAMLEGVSAPAAATPILATIYAMFFGGLLVLGARLGDRYGHRRVLLAGCVAFALVSLIGASAQEIVQLVASRGLQGAAAAISVPSALRLLLDEASEPDDRRGALAAWSASGAAAGAAGLLVGGFLTESLGWRAVFWVNVPVGIVLVVAILVSIPRSGPEKDRTPLDLVGAALLTGAVMVLIVGTSLLESPHSRTLGAVLAAAGLVAGVAFVTHQRRSGTALIPPAAFASPNLRTGTAVSFVNTATTSSTAVIATLSMQEEFGISAVGAGVALLPLSLGVVVGSALTKPLGARLSSGRLAATGLAAIAAGNVVLALTYGAMAGLVAGVCLAGLGLGVASVAGTAIGTDVSDDLSGTASGVLNTGAQLGTAIGVAALLLLASVFAEPGTGTVVAWAAIAVLAAVTTLALLTRSGATQRAATH